MDSTVTQFTQLLMSSPLWVQMPLVLALLAPVAIVVAWLLSAASELVRVPGENTGRDQ